jgi:hypothetical protein
MRRRTRQDGELANKSTSRHKYRVAAATLPFDGIFTIVGNRASAMSIMLYSCKVNRAGLWRSWERASMAWKRS